MRAQTCFLFWPYINFMSEKSTEMFQRPSNFYYALLANQIYILGTTKLGLNTYVCPFWNDPKIQQLQVLVLF